MTEFAGRVREASRRTVRVPGVHTGKGVSRNLREVDRGFLPLLFR